MQSVRPTQRLIGGALLLAAAAFAAATFAQSSSKPSPSPENIKIITPTVDKPGNTVTLPAAFWNEHLADWLDVAFCGRPSDFLHETIVCSTTTRALLEKSLRDIGCRDGDTWADNLKQFTRVRGDRLLVTLEFSRTPDGKKETWSIDELLTFQGWGIPVGPYGFMYKGDPGTLPGAAQSPPPAAPQQPDPDNPFGTAPPPPQLSTDAGKILHDDPQIAVAFRRFTSQSFADHPLAYDEWVYPAPFFARNYNALPSAVYDSNGTIPVTLTIQKVTDEQLLRESARLWHDDNFRQYILRQIPIAQQIDKDKAALFAARANLLAQRVKKSAAEAAHAPANQAAAYALWSAEAEYAMLAVNIEKNYATLDSAWAAWAADHVRFESNEPQVVESLKLEAARWKKHLQLRQTRAEQLALAERASWDQLQLSTGPAMDQANETKMQQARGREIAARSAALLADNQQPLDYWQDLKKNLDPADPRASYITDVTLHVELTTAREAAAKLGIAYGSALAGATSTTLPPETAALQSQYAHAQQTIALAETRLALANVNFEISKREGFEDPDLPGLKKQRDELTARLKDLEATTRPAP